MNELMSKYDALWKHIVAQGEDTCPKVCEIWKHNPQARAFPEGWTSSSLLFGKIDKTNRNNAYVVSVWNPYLCTVNQSSSQL